MAKLARDRCQSWRRMGVKLKGMGGYVFEAWVVKGAQV